MSADTATVERVVARLQATEAATDGGPPDRATVERIVLEESPLLPPARVGLVAASVLAEVVIVTSRPRTASTAS